MQDSNIDNDIYHTFITKCKFTVLENGNIVPIICFNPIVIKNVKRESAMLSSWVEFDRLRPRIGDKAIIASTGKYINIIATKRSKEGETIPRPTKCPICQGAIVTNATETILRCSNEECGFHDIRRIYKYYMYCCLDLNIKFRHVIKLYKAGKLKCIPDIYNLDLVDYLDIDIDKKDALRIVYNVETNREIPLQNLYYSIIGCCIPIQAIKLATLVTNEKDWVNPITVIKKTRYITKGYVNKYGIETTTIKNIEDDKLITIQNILNNELEKNKLGYSNLSRIIKIILVPVRLPLCKATFVTTNLVQTTKAYLETVIRLNDGSVEDNFNTIMWGRVDGIIGNLKPINKNIQEGINMGINIMSETEFRGIIPTVKIANLFDNGYEKYDYEKYNNLQCESMDFVGNIDTEETEDE